MHVAFDSMMALKLNGTMALVVVAGIGVKLLLLVAYDDWPLIDQKEHLQVAKAEMPLHR